MIKEINTESFSERIIGMMNDYDITMFDALLWDFESFGFDLNKIVEGRGVTSLERSFRVYLVKNGIEDSKDEDFFADVFMGRSNNMKLGKNVKDAKEQSK